MKLISSSTASTLSQEIFSFYLKSTISANKAIEQKFIHNFLNNTEVFQKARIVEPHINDFYFSIDDKKRSKMLNCSLICHNIWATKNNIIRILQQSHQFSVNGGDVLFGLLYSDDEGNLQNAFQNTDFFPYLTLIADSYVRNYIDIDKKIIEQISQMRRDIERSSGMIKKWYDKNGFFLLPSVQKNRPLISIDGILFDNFSFVDSNDSYVTLIGQHNESFVREKQLEKFSDFYKNRSFLCFGSKKEIQVLLNSLHLFDDVVLKNSCSVADVYSEIDKHFDSTNYDSVLSALFYLPILEKLQNEQSLQAKVGSLSKKKEVHNFVFDGQELVLNDDKIVLAMEEKSFSTSVIWFTEIEHSLAEFYQKCLQYEKDNLLPVNNTSSAIISTGIFHEKITVSDEFDKKFDIIMDVVFYKDKNNKILGIKPVFSLYDHQYSQKIEGIDKKAFVQYHWKTKILDKSDIKIPTYIALKIEELCTEKHLAVFKEAINSSMNYIDNIGKIDTILCDDLVDMYPDVFLLMNANSQSPKNFD